MIRGCHQIIQQLFSKTQLNLASMSQSAGEIMRSNIEVMNSLEGFNVVIVCCSSPLQANYWQSRLEDGKGSVIASSSVVLAVHEDWPGGAGNGIFHYCIEFLLGIYFTNFALMMLIFAHLVVSPWNIVCVSKCMYSRTRSF